MNNIILLELFLKHNPKHFNPNDMIVNTYSGKMYIVIEPDKRGMAYLKNIETGRIEQWNSCNNPSFEIAKKQLQLL